MGGGRGQIPVVPLSGPDHGGRRAMLTVQLNTIGLNEPGMFKEVEVVGEEVGVHPEHGREFRGSPIAEPQFVNERKAMRVTEGSVPACSILLKPIVRFAHTGRQITKIPLSLPVRKCEQSVT